MTMNEYIYKTKHGFGGLLRAGLTCKIIAIFHEHVMICVESAFANNACYWGLSSDLESKEGK